MESVPASQSGTIAPLRADRAEREVIGACLIDPSCVATLALSPEDFFGQGSRETFAAMRAITGRGDTPIFTRIMAEIAARGGKVKASTLVSIAAECSSSVWVDDYASEVRRAAKRRRLMSAGSSIEAAAGNPGMTADRAADLAADLIHDADVHIVKDEGVKTSAELMALHAARQALSRSGVKTGVPTGFYDLDRHIVGGLRGGQFCVIGARTGMGKSAIMREMARTMAFQGRVLFFSNEMSEADLAARDITVFSETPLAEIAGMNWDASSEESISSARLTMGFLPLLTKADGALTSASVRSWAKKVHHEEPIIAIFVDFIQRMADPGRTDLERVSNTARSLKSIAMEFDVPLIAGSQLSRTTERENQDTRPGLIDLRNSGEIEQEADIVLLLYRASYHYPNEAAWHQARKKDKYPGNVAELAIAKQRQGASGVTVNLLWVPQLATFRNLARTV